MCGFVQLPRVRGLTWPVGRARWAGGGSGADCGDHRFQYGLEGARSCVSRDSDKHMFFFSFLLSSLEDVCEL